MTRAQITQTIAKGAPRPRGALLAMLRVVALFALFALPATAQGLTQAEVNQTLREHPQISQGLFAVALATAVRDICPEIEGRLFRGLSYLNGLQQQAMALGFSRSQIRAFVEDPAEVALMYERVRAYARARGAAEDQPETVCALGRAEIAAGSDAGRLLRQR